MRSLFMFLLVLAVPFLLPQATWPQAVPQEVIIGFAGPLDLPQVKNARNAAQLAIDEANRSSLRINGHPLKFKLWDLDDKSETRSVEYVAKTFSQGGAVAVIGHWVSPASITAAPIYHAAGIPQITPYSWSSAYTRLGFSTSFQAVPSDEEGLYLAARYFSDRLHARRVVIVDDGLPLGISLADKFQKGADEAGMVVLERMSVSSNTSDFNDALKLAKLLSPDLVYFSGRVSQSDTFARSMIRLNVPGFLMVTDAVINRTFLDRVGDTQNRIFAFVSGPSIEKKPAFQRLQKRYAEHFDGDLLTTSTFSYDSVNAVIAAIKQGNSTSRASVVRNLRRIELDGISGNIRFNAQGALDAPNYTLYWTGPKQWESVAELNSGTFGERRTSPFITVRMSRRRGENLVVN